MRDRRNERSAVEDFIALRLDTLGRTPGFRVGLPARQRLAEAYQRGDALGRTHERLPGRAQLVFFRDPRSWFGGPCVVAFVDRAGGDDEALDFLCDALDRHAGALGPETYLEIDPRDPELFSSLRARGFGLDSVIQVGSPELARRRLGPVPAPDLPLTLAPLADHRELVPDVVAMHGRVFAREPEYCWFGAFPAHLEGLGKNLLERPEGQFAVLLEGELAGHLGAELEDNPFWGRAGGLELLLTDALRGRGLARWLYAKALDVMNAGRADVMKGGTAQPGVLHLGRVLGRPWHALGLRRDAPFPTEHFLRFAPEDVARAHELEG